MLTRFLALDPLLVILSVLILSSAAVAAAPVHPFPAAKKERAQWWKDGASLALPNGGGTLSLAWDAENFYVHVENPAKAGALTLQVITGARRIAWKDGAAEKPSFPATVTMSSGALDARMTWKDLGLPAGQGGKAMPFSVGFQPAGGGMKWLPGTPLLPNPMTWGALYFNDGRPLSACAETLVRPFVFAFHATGSAPYLTIDPEPETGLCVPAEVIFRTVGDTTTEVGRTSTKGRAARYETPDTPAGVFGSIAIRVPGYIATVPEVEYRALPRGQALEEYRGTPGWTEPADWREYWNRARADLAQIRPDVTIEEVPERESKTGRLYKVSMTSLENVRFACWYFVPKDVDVLAGKAATRYPAVQIMPGYGGEEPPLDWTARGLITLSVNPRGHGPSNAYWPLPPNHLAYNIEDAERYYYRSAFMDCVRAVQWLMERPEVIPERVGVEGSSQGGAFALATAALEPRVASCSVNVPFLCDLPTSARLSSRGGMGGLRPRFEAQTPEGATIRKTLSYIDGSFMAQHIRCPILIAAGQMDRTCPPEGAAAAYHKLRYPLEQRLILVPGRDHEVMPEWREATFQWYERVLKGKN